MSEEKKIIIDEDWKSQVEAEREELRQQSEAKQGPHDEAAPSAAMPPASFEMLISALVAEAMVHLGQAPHPSTGQPVIDLAHARYSIDLLEVLSEKTKGNLTDSEEKSLAGLLHQLRMAFVAVQSQPAAAPPTE